MRLSLICWLILTAAGLLGCTLGRSRSAPIRTGPTPREAVENYEASLFPQIMTDYNQFVGEIEFAEAAGILLFQPPIPEAPELDIHNESMVFYLVLRDGAEWRVTTALPIALHNSAEPPGDFKEQTLDYGDGYSVVFGKIVDPDIQQVEASYSDGRQVRVDVNAQTFLILVPDRLQLCQLEWIGGGNQLVYELDVTRYEPTPLPHPVVVTATPSPTISSEC